ncbi:type II toxin-antitoxin system VapC family toxin [Candidatus Bathyarchaeota archaeon]|nr:type II toxin-antitoxin system VapC family toxin [Candidatus Bathyarchaeota archaeon]
MERNEEIVVDASVVVKWFVEEEYSTEALKLRNDYVVRLIDVVAPALLPFEVLNALRYNPEFGEKDLKEVAEALMKYDLWLFPILGKLAERTIENALKYGITIYDSSYISLAEVEDKPLYTADEKLLMKLKGNFYAHHITEYKRKI